MSEIRTTAGAPAPSPSGAPAARTRAHRPAGAVDLAAVTLLVASAVVGFGPTYGGTTYVRAAVGGTLLGLALAWLGARLRWPLLTVTAATIGVYVLLGGALAVPRTAIAGVLPTLDTLETLLLGAVTSWKGLLTATPPVGGMDDLLVVPFLSTLLAAVLAGSLALRARRPAWALLPVAVLGVGVILLGTWETAQPLVQGLVFGGVAVVWIAWRRAGARAEALRTSGGATAERGDATRLRARRVRNAVALLAGAALVSAFAAPTLAPDTPRFVLRDQVEPPLDLHDYPSPLAGFRTYVRDLENEPLLTVAGLPDGARLRLATLDLYTGTVLDIAGGSPTAPAASGSFGRVGSVIPVPPDAPEDATTAQVTVVIAGYRGVWVPTVGAPTAIAFDGARAGDLQGELHVNTATGTALTTAGRGLAEGDEVTLTAEVAAPIAPTDGALAGLRFARLAMPAADGVPQAVGSLASRYAGEAPTPTDAARAEAVRAGLARDGVFSDGLDTQAPSQAGHGAARIDALLGGRQMIGDDEQFAVAMALMARDLGMPARVVMGFYPLDDTPVEGGTYTIRGTDVHAWVEIAYEDAGTLRWVAYDPTPSDDQTEQEQDPRSMSEPEPQVLQEPPPPEEPAEAPLEPITEAAEDEPTDEEGVPWTRYVGIVAAVVLPLLVLLSPFALVIAAKSRRRSRRIAAATTVDRLSGGWREVVDTAVDLGTPVPVSATRRETARDLAEHFPGAPVVPVAERADAAVFGAGEPTEAEATAFWAEVDRVVGDMSQSVGRWQRLRGRVSLRSFGREPSTRGWSAPLPMNHPPLNRPPMNRPPLN